MTIAPSRDVSNVFGVSLRSGLMAAASVAISAGSASAAPNCAAGTAGDDVCIITLANTGTEAVDAGANTVAGDKLQFGGGADFSFDVSRIGTATLSPLKNFELYEKIDAATVTLTGTATVQTNWTISAGTLLATGSTAAGEQGSILNTSTVTIASGATFGLIGTGGADEVIGTLTGAAGSFVTLGLDGTLITASSADSTFAGVISGTGHFTKDGPGKLTLSGINNISGSTNVTGGTLIMTSDNASTGAVNVLGSGTLEIGHAGAIDNASLVTIGSGATLKGTVAYTIGGNVDNSGLLQGNLTIGGNVTNKSFIRPGQSPGIVTIGGNYAAAGTAVFDMEVDLDAALAAPVNGTTHDFINILGNVTPSTNKTFVLLTALNTPDAGLPTTGNGIELIRVGGTASAGDFVQASALNAGAYQYVLRHVPNYSGATDGYFLQSAVRDELVAQPALLTAGQNLIRNCFRDDQRVPDSPKGASYGRAWFGYRQGNTSHGADTGVEMDQDFSCTSGGMDWRMGHGWFGGVSGGFGSSTVDMTTAAGPAMLDGDARVIEAYASFTSSSLFINLSAGYNDMDWAYLGTLMGADASSSGFIGSAQAGVALDAEVVAVKLFGSINYDGTNCGDSCFGFAVVEDTGTVEAKGTVRFDGVSWGGSVRPWAAVSYTDILSGGVNTASIGAVMVSSDTLNQLLSIDGGLQTYLDENLSLFLDGGYHESLGKEVSGYKGAIGMKLYW